MSSLLDRVVDAHGGMERWRKVIRLDVRLSVSGSLFQIKGHPEGLHDVIAHIDPHRPAVTICPFGRPDCRGHFTHDRVWIEDREDRITPSLVSVVLVTPDINEFVSHYSVPGAMRAGFEYYRAVPQDAIENQNYSKTKLTMPVLAVGGSYYPALGGNVTDCTVSSCTIYAMKALAQNVRGIQIPNSGHWGPEERPDFVIKMLDNFFGGNTITTK
ncbi:MAG TPA: alpha/beta hydrolase [Candidatus Bathyarchaeia archaeon]|nr:alpha/beta hydrolase [Candidatus Bathyarchaeia archaeon]